MDLCFCIAANDPRALDERAPDLATYHVSCLEITWKGFPHWDPRECARLRDGLANHGLRMRSIHMPFGPELNIIDDDPGLRLHALEAHLHMLPATAALGVEIVVMHPGREFVSDRPLSELVDSCIDATRLVTDRASELGMRVALENVLPAHALSAHDHPALGICLDTGHAHVVDNVVRAIDVFAHRIIHVHLHDNQGDTDKHLCPGLGNIDWPPAIERLREVGYSGPLTLECRPPKGVAKDEIRKFVLDALGERDRATDCSTCPGR